MKTKHPGVTHDVLQVDNVELWNAENLQDWMLVLLLFKRKRLADYGSFREQNYSHSLGKWRVKWRNKSIDCDLPWKTFHTMTELPTCQQRWEFQCFFPILCTARTLNDQFYEALDAALENIPRVNGVLVMSLPGMELTTRLGHHALSIVNWKN